MKRPGRPLFLAPAPYRQRRLQDAARLLPVLGFILLILPLLWVGPRVTGQAIYLFGVWLLLILLAAVFARALLSGDRSKDEDG